MPGLVIILADQGVSREDYSSSKARMEQGLMRQELGEGNRTVYNNSAKYHEFCSF